MKRAKGVVLSLALVAQACGPAPQAEPSASAAPSSVPSSASTSAPIEPSPSVSASASMTATWESVGLPEPGAEPRAGLWDETGVIVTGAVNCPDLSDCWHDPAIWTSADGRTWTRAEVPYRQFTVITAITRGADAYYAAGYNCESRVTGLFYRSKDGRDWDLLGSLDLGNVDDDECNTVEHLMATEAGLVATLKFDVDDSPRVFESPDGAAWTPVSSETFGLPRKVTIYQTDTAQVDPSTAILAAGCAGCPVAAWKSGDGGAWTELGKFDFDGTVYGLAAATGPRVVVVASSVNQSVPVEQCPAPCGGTAVWALDADGSVHEVHYLRLPYLPHLAYTGDAYLLLGTASRSALGPAGAFASADGLAWASAEPDPDICGAIELIGGPSQALLLTRGYDPPGQEELWDDCGGMWLVDVLPG